METNDKYSKYPISKRGKQCLGHCYEAGTWIVHPHTLDYVTDPNHPFCPVQSYVITDTNTNNKEYYEIDNCNMPTHKKDIPHKEIELNILFPHIDFNCKQFLRIYYNINSFDDASNWIAENNKSSIFTRLRIIECTWKSYGEKIDLIDDRLVNFYIEVVKKQWIGAIYKLVKKYILIENNKISVKKNTQKDNNYRIQKINYIINKFITKNDIYKLLNNYIIKYNKKWDTIKLHNDNIKKELIKYILNKLDDIINNKLNFI